MEWLGWAVQRNEACSTTSSAQNEKARRVGNLQQGKRKCNYLFYMDPRRRSCYGTLSQIKTAMAENVQPCGTILGVCSTRLSAAAIVQDPKGNQCPLTRARTKHSHWESRESGHSCADRKRQKTGVLSHDADC